MKKALFVIDYQEDFVADDGLLTCGLPAQDIEDAILTLIEEKRKDGYDIIFTLDSHDEETWQTHPESEAFNIHCQVGTKGHELYGKVKDARQPEDIVIEKKRYGVSMKEWPGEYDILEFSGVTTHICVLQNMIMAYNNFPGVTLVLHSNAVASFDEKWHELSLEYMRNVLGATII